MQVNSPTAVIAPSGARGPNNPQSPQNPHHGTAGALRAGRLDTASEREAPSTKVRVLHRHEVGPASTASGTATAAQRKHGGLNNLHADENVRVYRPAWNVGRDGAGTLWTSQSH